MEYPALPGWADVWAAGPPGLEAAVSQARFFSHPAKTAVVRNSSRAITAEYFSRPFGTHGRPGQADLARNVHPALACWAIFSRPFGTCPDTASRLVSFQQHLPNPPIEKPYLDKTDSQSSRYGFRDVAPPPSRPDRAQRATPESDCIQTHALSPGSRCANQCR